ncbi:MAG: hypothetical protein AMXMBFR84_25400 [Candidatus Hydrogenedentota bacterium]
MTLETFVEKFDLFADTPKDVVVRILIALAEQRRNVAKVGELIALVDQLETQLTAFRTALSNLLNAMVADPRTGIDLSP